MTIALFSTGGEWISFLIGLYGALVATAIAFIQVVRERPGVKLILNPTNVAYDSYESDGAGGRIRKPATTTKDFWGVRIVNHRKRPITIRDGGLLGGRGQLIHTTLIDIDSGGGGDEPFPATLTDGQSIEFYLPLDWERDAQRVGVWVIDDLNNIYRTYIPSRNLWRRWKERRARRRAERVIAGLKRGPKPAEQSAPSRQG